MMNIKSAIRQMRVARRLGKLSSEQSARLLRRLGHSYALSQHEKIKAEMTAPTSPSPEWLALMELRNSIEAEVLPQLEAARQADALLNKPAERRKAFTVMDACRDQAVSATVEVPKLEGYEYTPDWWKDAEIRERTARREANVCN